MSNGLFASRWRILSRVDSPDHVVFVVDDDVRICEALTDLLSTFDLPTVTFRSAAEYLAYPKPDVPACLVLDVQLPDINGLDLQAAERDHPPIVFITGHGDIPMSVRAIKAGAVDFLTKPLKEADLIRVVHAAITQDRIDRLRRADLIELRRRWSRLTPREREVLPLIVSGLLNNRRRAARHQRRDPPDSSWQDHEEDGGGFAGRSGEDGRDARNTASPTAVRSACPSNGLVNTPS